MHQVTNDKNACTISSSISGLAIACKWMTCSKYSFAIHDPKNENRFTYRRLAQLLASSFELGGSNSSTSALSIKPIAGLCEAEDLSLFGKGLDRMSTVNYEGVTVIFGDPSPEIELVTTQRSIMFHFFDAQAGSVCHLHCM